MQRNWTIKNTKTGEYAHLFSEHECEQRKQQWLARGDKDKDIEIKYDPPGVCRIMP